MRRTFRMFIRPMVLVGCLWLTLAGLWGCGETTLKPAAIVSEPGAVTALENPGGVELPVVMTAGREETDLVNEMILHRTLYARFLRILTTYYAEQGFDEKARWAHAELADLQAVTPYRYVGDGPTLVSKVTPSDEGGGEPAGPITSLETPAGIDVPTIQVADRHEVDLVEELILHRTMYARFLRALTTYYVEAGYTQKLEWALDELNGLKFVKPYRYIRESITPVATLRPTESIPEADALYQAGLALMKKGGHGVIVVYDKQIMKLALAKFKELVYSYPTSDKIDDAAFMIGEIHKEYFEENDNRIAVMWYQRAIDWNPRVPFPARFQMAVVYDYRLHEREEALRWYQEVVEKEEYIDASNVRWAQQRIHELTSEETRRSPGEVVGELQPRSGAPEVPPPAPRSPARVP